MALTPLSGGGEQVGSASHPVQLPGIDEQLNQLADTCASLLGARRTHIFEVTCGSRIARYGQFPPAPCGSTAEFCIPISYEDVLERAMARSGSHVEPVCDGGGVVIGALVVPELSAQPAFSTDNLGAVWVLLRNAFEARSLRARTASLECQLEDSRARLRQVSDAVPTGITIVDPGGIIVDLNNAAATILGECRSSVIGRSFHDFVRVDDMDAVMSGFRMRLECGQSIDDVEFRIVRASGELRTLLVGSTTLRDGGTVTGVCFAARDITDEQIRLAQLRRAERFANVGSLLGGICHELNNPLTSIKSFAELMLLDDRSEDDKEALEIVRREAARAARIVSDLRLVASKTREDGAQVTSLDLNELVRHGVEALRGEFEDAGIDVRLELAESLGPLSGLKPQLERVVEQLLSNAAFALRENSRSRRITLQTYPTAFGMALRVADNGPGIHPADVERIFDPFWTTRTTGEGTGLGLSLIDGIVAEHNGQIRVDGGWGSGAVFTVDLPLGSDALSMQQEPTVRKSARNALRILIVDDEAPIRFSVGRYLTRRGHTVAEAEDGGRALAMLEESGDPYDIIVADLRMPGLGGDQLFARLRADGRGLEERLVFITGDADSPDMADVLSAAGVPVVLKPFELAEIAQIIESQAETLQHA